LNFSELRIFGYATPPIPAAIISADWRRANQRTGDDQLRFEQARERDCGFDLRASIRVEFDRIAAHDPAFAIPWRFAVAP